MKVPRPHAHSGSILHYTDNLTFDFIYPNRFLVTILEHIIISLSFYFIISTLSFFIMASMDISESGFQTPASKIRKASDSPSLPPASQPSMSPSSYKNRTPLIATGTDPKFNTKIRIMR